MGNAKGVTMVGGGGDLYKYGVGKERMVEECGENARK